LIIFLYYLVSLFYFFMRYLVSLLILYFIVGPDAFIQILKRNCTQVKTNHQMQLINFSINSAHKFLSNNNNDALNVHPLFNHIWHWKGLTQIHSVLWKLACRLLLTNAVRAHRQMTTNDTCPKCQSRPEIIMHMLLDYEDAQNY
jgi:hypothetical protein